MFGFTSYSQTSFSDTGVVDVAVSVTGVEGTGQVGDVIARNVIRAFVTGVEATMATGGATAEAGAIVSVTGLEATGEVGSIASVIGDANVFPTEQVCCLMALAIRLCPMGRITLVAIRSLLTCGCVRQVELKTASFLIVGIQHLMIQ